MEGAPGFPGASGVLFEQAMAQTRMAVCLADPNQPDYPIVFVNRAFRELTGYDEQDVMGRNCRLLQGPETDRAQVARLRDAILAEDVIVVELLNYRKDGTPFWNALHIGPIYHADGRLRYIFGSQWDVTEVHAARADEAHARMMEREISHRMKNMFSVITSIVSMTGTLDGVPRTASKINDRIRALGRAHEATLDSSSRGGPVDPTPLFREILLPYMPRGVDSVTFEGGAVDLDSNVVTLLALIIHEMAANATRHGALSEPAGEVSLEWHADTCAEGNPRLALSWRETGGPRLEGPPDVTHVGLGLLHRLVQAAGGELEQDWRPEGLHTEIRLPIQK